MSTDLAFFEQNAPVVLQMYSAITAVGWALLLGNLVFQSMRIMVAGSGEIEHPASLVGRTFVYGFLLLGSRQILGIGLGIGTNIINVIGLPTTIGVTVPDVEMIGVISDDGWFIAAILSVIIGVSLIKMFFAIGERYVVLCVLILLAPIGFSMGGSKATKDIATGFVRMFASMLLLVILNVVFLRLILSVLATVPTNATILPWVILIVGLSRVSRKADQMVTKIGLNPVIGSETTSGGRGGFLMMTLLAAKMLLKNTAAGAGNSSTGTNSGRVKSSNSGVKTSSVSTTNSPPVGTENKGKIGQNQTSKDSRTSTSNPADNRVSQSLNSDAKQQIYEQQNLNSASDNSLNSKVNQGGNSMPKIHQTDVSATAEMSIKGTQINTNRFGLPSNNPPPSPPLHDSQISPQSSSVSAQSDVIKGKNDVSANRGKSEQIPVNKGKNGVPANRGKSEQTSVNKGKNPIFQSPISTRFPQSDVVKGKNNIEPTDVNSGSESPPASANIGDSGGENV
jgi:hypothetical protein